MEPLNLSEETGLSKRNTLLRKSFMSLCAALLLATSAFKADVVQASLTQAAEKALATQGSLPTVALDTDLGRIALELFPDKSPATVNNFLSYCQEGFYAGTIFHRVIPGFVVQGGGMTFDYVKKETREPVINESHNGLFNQPGTVAMARLPDPDSATSQFFINLNNNTHLDPQKDKPGYTVFGRVIGGMDVVQKITQEPQGKYRPQAPDLPVRILSCTTAAGNMKTANQP